MLFEYCTFLTPHLTPSATDPPPPPPPPPPPHRTPPPQFFFFEFSQKLQFFVRIHSDPPTRPRPPPPTDPPHPPPKKKSFLAHLSRRLIGELIVYKGIRRPSVRRPSVVRLSTFSNDISSEAVRPILFIFHI